MTVALKNLRKVGDIPRECDICHENRYGDFHHAHAGGYKGITRIFMCGRRIVYYYSKEVPHWNCYYAACENATKVVEELHVKEQGNAQV
jgi:hypothetical protein